MYTLRRLEWDSDFFGLEVGELSITNALNKDLILDLSAFDWIVVKQTTDIAVPLNNFENTLKETKCTFSKSMNGNKSHILKIAIQDNDKQMIQPEQIYDLAYESGKYSRFKLDANLSTQKFKKLYQKWVDNSLNHKFADKVFFIKDDDSILGFVTIKKNLDHASIGLIAVSEECQGKGYGRQLLQKAENYCISEGIKELRIPTQKKNSVACHFYKKNNYQLSEELILKHYWKIQQ